MKSLLLTITFLFSICLSFSANSDLFNVDEEKMNSELKELNILESLVLIHGNNSSQITDFLKETESDMNPSNILLFSSINATIKPPLGIPSFIWGCVLGLP